MNYFPYLTGAALGIGYIAFAFSKKSKGKRRNNLTNRVVKYKKQNLAIEKQIKGLF